MMMNSTFLERMHDEQKSADFAAEDAKVQFAIELSRIMEAEDISRTELSRRLNVTMPMVTKILRGDSNLTIETMAKSAHAVGGNLHLHIAQRGMQGRWLGFFKEEGPMKHLRLTRANPVQASTKFWKRETQNETESLAA